MIVTPVPVRGATAVRDALLSHGWEGDLASLTAGGLELAAFHVQPVPTAALQAMVPLAARLGLELVTGDDWLLLAGPRARLGAFARPWVQPEPVQGLAQAVGMAMPPEPAREWHHAGGTLTLGEPVLIGVINVTPDSFSPASRALDADAALALADRLLAGGATVLDVGGESTRPGAVPLDAAEERARVVPVVRALAARHPALPISVDTVHAATARAALEAGAVILNDVTAGRHDPDLLAVAATGRAGLVLSHSRGSLGTLASYDHADYGGDVVRAVATELAASRRAATAAGVPDAAIVLDPGFGFGKTPAQNWQLLDGLDAIVALGRPVLAAVSRKRFLGEATGQPIEGRDAATAAACALAADRGARLFRVHEPAAVRDALRVAEAVRWH
ncbi:MAG TPA: dihydropteroate synthase [Gemmatimonadales bacterium]|mgnify:CR=1 FL=1|nr:dihydropteroate synthase [Gemmatimonadales bacterium]